jgi:glyoxylase I family protein
MALIHGLLHATFVVQDLPRARKFYEGVLGLPLNSTRPEMSFPGVWYDIGPQQQIHLMQLPSPEFGLQRPEHGGRDRHIALAVNDLNALVRQMEGAGVGYTMSKSGRRALFCRDPDGNALEFMEG